MGGAGGLRRAHTPTHLRLGHFLLAKRGCLQAGQSTVRMGGKEDRKNLPGLIPAAPREQPPSKPSRSAEGLNILICKMGSRG